MELQSFHCWSKGKQRWELSSLLSGGYFFTLVTTEKVLCTSCWVMGTYIYNCCAKNLSEFIGVLAVVLEVGLQTPNSCLLGGQYSWLQRDGCPDHAKSPHRQTVTQKKKKWFIVILIDKNREFIGWSHLCPVYWAFTTRNSITLYTALTLDQFWLSPYF